MSAVDQLALKNQIETSSALVYDTIASNDVPQGTTERLAVAGTSSDKDEDTEFDEDFQGEDIGAKDEVGQDGMWDAVLASAKKVAWFRSYFDGTPRGITVRAACRCYVDEKSCVFAHC